MAHRSMILKADIPLSDLSRRPVQRVGPSARAVAASVLALWLSGCAHSPSRPPPEPSSPAPSPTAPLQLADLMPWLQSQGLQGLGASRDAVLFHAHRMLPRWAVLDPKADMDWMTGPQDCSGFVRWVFQQALGTQLPRQAAEQARAARWVAETEAKAGDPVFFNTLGAPRSHVGIYMGDGRFIHAPRLGNPVRIERLDQDYWRKRLEDFRRPPPLLGA